MHRVELVGKRERPVVEHVHDRYVVGDAEGEIEIGEAVAAVHGERAHDCPGNDALIFIRELQQPLADSVALLNGEHEARF